MLKKVKKAVKAFLDSNPGLEHVFDKKVFETKEYRALAYVNSIANTLDAMEKDLGYDPLDGDELFILMRFQVGAFLKDLMEKVTAHVNPSEE